MLRCQLITTVVRSGEYIVHSCYHTHADEKPGIMLHAKVVPPLAESRAGESLFHAKVVPPLAESRAGESLRQKWLWMERSMLA
jgi:hypothetical protein